MAEGLDLLSARDLAPYFPNAVVKRGPRDDLEVAGRRVHVEPGLIASVGRLRDGALPGSVIALEPGADAGRVLTDLVGRPGFALLQAQAADLMRFKLEHRLSRYNAAAAVPLASSPGRDRVLIAANPADELSLGGPRPGAQDYADLIRAARRDFPRARLILQRAPALMLSSEVLALADEVIDGEADLIGLIQQVDQVYTVGGLAGLEAVLLGRHVTCTGAPFYAGRGLTDDRAAATSAPLSLEDLFAAAYLAWPSYVDRLTGEPCSAHTAFERLAVFKAHAERVRGHWRGVDLAPAKHRVFEAFLCGPTSRFTTGLGASEKGSGERYALWASRPSRRTQDLERRRRDCVVFIEDGFLRSIGLGSSFHPAGSLVLDSEGIYYDPNGASELQSLLNGHPFDEALLARARALRLAVVAAGLSKYNVTGVTGPKAAGGSRRRILIPGQVENDASVLAGGGGLDNVGLLHRVRAANPDAHLIYREHPDVAAGNRPGKIARRQLQGLVDEVADQGDITSWLDCVDEVHTLTSLTGFEALLRGKTVACYGAPFYAGWGLTTDLGAPTPARTRRLSLDALVAAALILYPAYLDPVSQLPCSPEFFVERLRSLRERQVRKSAPAPRFGSVLRFLRAAALMARPARCSIY